ncbi:hypothetical protein E3P81_01001 [Wallemia ichthyophaga]|uniref:Pre-mRNA-splicing factor SPF27 n=1 Tax=Wallemia ichthyophaga TaxID=245174 RepID=A0A4T0IR10_WALIC|nr:hypothetical protein E3P97_01002 [Wallemia ichthyophaga]TIB06439.1 hypothetical protein E3P96_00412 [Wallemia ichthyophaga]TIB29581.1 hypothetical protein E3P85_03115 [Wallemia ichthyophaga]TIB43258.1 hypothetical protein E3P86_00048 [Wallemia ichthyophaga]TIB49111.1 hypothetical protein E3P82_01000 [Wallemia ichthyophaga]
MSATQADYKLDSLPYYDREIDSDQHLRDAAARLVAEEMRSGDTNPASDIPPHESTSLSSSRLLTQELERVGHGSPLTAFDGSRYALAEPEDGEGSDGSTAESPWKQSLNAAAITAEYQQQRTSNLELLTALGANAWKVSNHSLDNDARMLETHSQHTRDRVVDINRLRKTEQGKLGDRLNALEKNWSALVSSNLELQVGSLALQVHLAELAEREMQLRASMSGSGTHAS